MVQLENKLDMIYDVVYKTRETRETEKLKELEKSLNQRRTEVMKALEKEKKDKIKRRTQLARTQASNLIAKTKDARRVLELQKNNELLGIFIKKCKEKGRAFTETKEYEGYLKEGLDNVKKDLKPGTYRVLMTKKDLEKYGDLLKGDSNYTFLPGTMGEDLIGGFLLTDEGKTYVLNNAIATKIEDHKYDMGRMLYEAFNKGGDDE